MRKMLLYILVIAAAMLIPEKGTDVGEILPVELLFLYKEEGMIILETDTGNLGRGETVGEAYKDLEETAPGVVFMDAADYLLVARSAKESISEMKAYLKPKTKVCQAEKGIDLELAARYLEVHKPGPELKGLDESSQLPKLTQEENNQKIRQKICN